MFLGLPKHSVFFISLQESNTAQMTRSRSYSDVPRSAFPPRSNSSTPSSARTLYNSAVNVAVNALKTTLFSSPTLSPTLANGHCRIPSLTGSFSQSPIPGDDSATGSSMDYSEDDEDSHSDESWASSSDADTAEPLPGSFRRPSDISGDSDDDFSDQEASADDSSSDSASSESSDIMFCGNSGRRRSRPRSSCRSSSSVCDDQPVSILSSETNPSIALSQRRSQSQLLLVSLLETFCMMYAPEDNRLMFQILCEKLSAIGIISEDDYRDQFSGVRGVYKRAFRDIVFQALLITRSTQLRRSLLPPPSSSSSLLIEHPPLPDDDHASELANGTDVPDLIVPLTLPENPPNVITRMTAKSKLKPLTVPKSPFGHIASSAGIADLLDLHTTRYRTDFDELRRLGKGGYGSVWHVRHRLDGREYAIKKVALPNPKDFDRVLREVKVLARMDHPNIVRYHSAWLEHDEVSLSRSNGHGDDDDSMGSSSGASLPSLPFPRNGSNHLAVPGPAPSPRQLSDLDVPDPPLCRPLTLFIQMELCYSSLHDYLLHRNTIRYIDANVLVTECNFLFQAVLVALEYIHERGTSHRDLTPRNLFLTKKPGRARSRYDSWAGAWSPVVDNEKLLPLCEWLKVDTLDDISIKIGDFGLVTEHLRRTESSLSSSPSPSPSSGNAPWINHFSASPINGSMPRRESVCGLARGVKADIAEGISATSHPSSKSQSPAMTPLSIFSKPIITRFGPHGFPQRASSPVPKSPLSRAASPAKIPSRVLPHMRRLTSHATTLGIGTETYSAPEQIASQGSSKYCWHPITSDMWSLGVILLELLHPFSTGMERLVTLERLRSEERTLPKDMITLFPQYAAIILWLTAEDPSKRPPPSELLAVFPPPVPDSLAPSCTGDGGASCGSRYRAGTPRGGRSSWSGGGLGGHGVCYASRATTPTCHVQSVEGEDPTQIIQLKRVIDEQHREIDQLRARLEEVLVRVGPPSTPPRVSSPENGEAPGSPMSYPF